MEQNFQKYLIISFILHLFFIGIFIYSIPSIFDKKLIQNDEVIFEMVDIIEASDFDNIKNQNLHSIEKSEVVEAKRSKIPESSPIVKEVKLEEPKVKEPKKEEPIIEESIGKEEPKFKEEDKPKNIAIPKEIKLKKPEKKVTKNKDPFEDILNGLEIESNGTSKDSIIVVKTSQGNKGNFTKGYNFDENTPLSVTEKLLIKKQIQGHNKVTIQAINLDILLTFKIEISEERILTKIDEVGTKCPVGSENICRLVRENAIRALKKSSPLQKLRSDRYDVWKEITLRFNGKGIV